MKCFEEITHEMHADVSKGIVRVVTTPKVEPKDFHDKMKAVIEELAKKHEFTKIRTSSYNVDFDAKDTTKAKHNVGCIFRYY